MMNDSLEALLVRLNSGDERAVEQMFIAFEPYMRMVIRRRISGPLRDKFDSGDIVQSVWADFVRGLHQSNWKFESLDQLRAFLVKMTRNRFVDRLRNHRESLRREIALIDETVDVVPVDRNPRVSEDFYAGELWQQMVDACPPAHYELLMMKRQALRSLRLPSARSCTREAFAEFCTILPGGSRTSVNTPPVPPTYHGNAPIMPASSQVTGENPAQRTAPSGDAWHLGDTTQTGLPPPRELTVALAQMADLWNGGKSVRAEQVLQEHPEVAADPETAVRIVYEEICLREERGEQVESAEFYRRFPQWHDALAVVLDCHRLLRNVQEPVQFPTPGESLGEFRLLLELGRGALGRVFLATQPSLSDRPLVVKLSARHGQEHLSLARLQHTNIVPLYLVQDFPDQHMRTLCMPYLGGATWNAILQGMKPIPPAQRTGEQIVARLSKLQRHADELKIASGPAIGFLARSTYVDAVCWIGACLADALHYAHQRGLVHLDIKPSNVLLACDGQPMLLDFHLACETRQLKENTIDRLGGTKGYMSPEQCAATEALRQGMALPTRLDSRSDIYSLGVLLYESLAGQLPDDEPNALRRNLRLTNPRVSRGLQDIVCKCLASNPSDRYADAGQLAADLRCHLASLPMRWNANRSLAERWRKWRRRKPYAIAILIVGLAATIVIGGAGGLFYRDHVKSAEALLLQSQREFENKDYGPAIQHAQSAWGSLHWFPWKGDLKNRITRRLPQPSTPRQLLRFTILSNSFGFLTNNN